MSGRHHAEAGAAEHPAAAAGRAVAWAERRSAGIPVSDRAAAAGPAAAGSRAAAADTPVRPGIPDAPPAVAAAAGRAAVRKVVARAVESAVYQAEPVHVHKVVESLPRSLSNSRNANSR